MIARWECGGWEGEKGEGDWEAQMSSNKYVMGM